MNEKPKPIATLGALLVAITEVIGASEQRILATLDGIENRIVGLEDKITELGKQADETKEDLQDRLRRIHDAVEAFDTSPIDEAAAMIDELVDAERRRERVGWLADARKAS